MTEAELLRAIEIASGGLGYAAWTVGITDDPVVVELSTTTLRVGARGERIANPRPDALNKHSVTKG